MKSSPFPWSAPDESRRRRTYDFSDADARLRASWRATCAALLAGERDLIANAANTAALI